jgi:hypothetical protein
MPEPIEAAAATSACGELTARVLAAPSPIDELAVQVTTDMAG